MPNGAMFFYYRFLLLILFCGVFSSFQRSTPLKTTRLFNNYFEVLSGSVKQLIETEHNHTTESETPQSWTIITSFAQNGNIISQTRREYWEKIAHEIKYSYKYNSTGKNTETIVKDNEKTMTRHKYGKDGLVNESSFYGNKNRLDGKEVYKYDKAGNTIEMDVDRDNYSYKVEYLYDSKGHRIKEVEILSKGEKGVEYLIDYKSFDSKGNWLKMIGTTGAYYSLPNGKKVELADTITRKITYY